MWLTQLVIVVCLVVGKGYARTQPTRPPTTRATLVTPSQQPNVAVIPQGGCLKALLDAHFIQSEPARRYLVTTKRGENRRTLLRKFPGTLGPPNTTRLASDAERDIPVAVVKSEQRKQAADSEVVEEDLPVCDDTLSGSDPDPEPNRQSDRRGKRSFDPNELTWNIDRLDERSLPLDGQFCPAANGTGVDVYVLDTGIRYSHMVFKGRASFGGYDAFGGDGADCQGHGTHCAGLAVGYLTGVAYGARVYSIKVLGCDLGGYFSYVIAGINHVIQRARQTGRRSVISMSLIGPKTEAVNVAIREAVANNIVVVTAAGNFRRDSCNYSPSSSPDVINVGGTQQAEDVGASGQHMLYWFNSRSNSPGSNYGRCLHIFAHGQWIRSASWLSNKDRRSLSGTSMACPTVAGVVATLLQRFPNYTPRQIRDQLIAESTPGVVNLRTYRGSNLPSQIAQTTHNRFAYTGRCNNIPETSTPRPPTSTTPPPIPGCVFDGLLYNHDATFNPNCTTKCSCNRGTLRCQPKRCYTDICQAYTNGHYHTFDGSSYDYQGTCEYVLVKPCNNDSFTISVGQTARDSNVVEINQVTITVPGERSIVFQVNRRQPIVTIGGEKLQRYDGNTMTVGEVLVQWIGGNVHATFEDTDFNVFWDGSNSIQVSVSSGLKNQLCGLCGFYNGRRKDDLRRRDGSTTKNVDNFALSWLHGNGNTRDKCQPSVLEPTCGKRPLRWANETCNAFNVAPFTSCHSEINPQPYIANCIRDFCACGKGDRAGRDACACKVIASYARACAHAGVNVTNWISRTQCSSGCTGIRTYKDCASFCQPTCSNYQSPPSCSKECASGCFCSNGQVLKGGSCVDPDTCDDEPPCKGTCLPSRKPIYFERFYLSEVDDLLTEAKRFDTVPTHITVYRDDLDMLFSAVFSRVDNASACTILTSATVNEVTRATKKLKNNRIVSVACYVDGSNKRCIAVFCPKKQKCTNRKSRTLPKVVCSFSQKYAAYQSILRKRYNKGFRVSRRKIYLDGTKLLVDVCYRKGITVSLHDGTDLRTLIQTVERNQQRGLYLADGNARMVGTRMVFSAVFTTTKYGSCGYRVLYNVDALRLYEQERVLNQDGYHITTIIPTTGDLTPLFIAVFWR